MDSAPASKPARPVYKIVRTSTPVAPIPSTRARLLTRPSLAPKTAARNVPETVPTARGETAQHFAVDPLVGRHLVGGVHVGLVRRAALRALHQGEHKESAEVRGQEDEQPGAQTAAARRPDVVAE